MCGGGSSSSPINLQTHLHYPGGTIGVHTGLITSSDDGEELIGVLAHEVAHVTAKHGLQSTLTSLGLSAILTLVAGDMDAMGQVVVQQLTPTIDPQVFPGPRARGRPHRRAHH